MMSDQEPRDQGCPKPPKRHWEATESFSDLKFSHWVEILLTTVLVCVGIGQLYVYIRQASIMDEQTKITARQLDAAQAQSRAFVTVNSIEFAGHKIGSEDRIGFWAIKAVAKNNGQTATKDMTVRYMLYSPLKGEGPPNFEALDTPPDPEFYQSVPVKARIGAKESIPIGLSGKANGTVDGDLGIYNGPMEWIADGSESAYYAGAIHYNDVFEGIQQHITKFCFVIRASRQSKDALANPYNAGLCPYWNCADEECKTDAEDFNAKVAGVLKNSPPATVSQPAK
jgi:hypothetical protein